MGVGGYSIPDSRLLREITAERAVVSFTKGRKGEAVGRARDGRVILPSRKGFRVYPKEVWEGRMWLHRSGRFYIFEPERCIKVNPKYREVPEFTAIYVNEKPAIYLARIETISEEPRFPAMKMPIVILVRPDETMVGGHIAIHLEAIAKVALRFEVEGTLTYSDIKERIENFKRLYGASAVHYDSKKLEALFREIPYDFGKLPKFAHDHRIHSETFVQRDRDGRAIRVSRCLVCGKWTISEAQRDVIPEEQMVGRGSRFTFMRRAVMRRERPFWSTKGMHRRSVVHARKSHRTGAQMKRRSRRTTQRHGTPAMWQSCKGW
jgi:hypothetical protein